MSRKSILKQFAFILSAFAVIGCNSISNDTKNPNVGYLVAPFDSDINYQCGEKQAHIDGEGRFECQSFPVKFYLGSKSLGYIESIHHDGYVFPQDLMQGEQDIVSFIRVASR